MTALTMKSSNALRQGVSSGPEHRSNESDRFGSRAAAPQRGFVSHAQPSKDFCRLPNHYSTTTENQELSIAENMMNMNSSFLSQESASSSPKTFPHILRTILNSNLHSDVMTWIRCSARFPSDRPIDTAMIFATGTPAVTAPAAFPVRWVDAIARKSSAASQ